MKPRADGLRLKAEWWLLALLLSAAVGALTLDRTLGRFDNLIYDLGLRADSIPSSDKILVVAIDNESLRRLGRWPWPREQHARLIDELRKAGPHAIAYDVLFTEPGPEAGDSALAEAVRQARPMFVPLSFHEPGRNGAAFDVIAPLPAIDAAADGVGHVNLRFDPDGLVRRMDMVFGSGQHQWRHLMTLVAETASAPGGSADMGERPLLIPFAGGTGHWPTVSAASVIAGEVPAEMLRDRLILVGATASALGDQYAVPLGAFMPGIEIQAHLLNGLLTDTMIGTASLGAMLAFALVPLWLLLVAFRLVPRSAALILTVGVVLLVLLVSGIALIGFRTWLPPGAALAGVCLAYPLWVWRQLVAADAFMVAELKRFEAEPDLIRQTAPVRQAPHGPNATTAMLHDAIVHAREMRHFLHDRLEQLPDATLVAGLDGTVMLCNAAARALFDGLDIPAEDRQGLATIFPHFRISPARETLTQPAAGPADDWLQDQFNQEVSVGDGRSFSLRIAQQRSSLADPIGWVVRITDISEAKAAQRQREDILQLLTHDMRSPQASIVAVLQTATPDQIDPAASARIQHYAERTLGLADGFVQLARAEALEYAVEEVDLFDMLTDALDDLWPQSAAKGISFEAIGEAGDLIVLGERSLLTRALINVMGNALKYSPPGTRVVCELSRMTGKDGQEMAACAVTDEGPGLAPGHRTTIFERFNRGPLGVGGRVDGVGLGLSFVHTVMVRHKGEIRCESEPGQGATFTLLLPLAPQPD